MSSEPDGKAKAVFLISMIGEEGTPERKQANIVRDYLVKKAFPTPEYKVERSDDNTTPGNITPQIMASIQRADLVVIDLTGFNPNVFYEMAVSHGLQRPVVHTIRSGSSIPFDVRDFRTVFYDTSDPGLLERAQKELRMHGDAAIKAPKEIRTPLSDASLFWQASTSTDPQGEMQASILDELQSIRSEMRQLYRGRPNPPRSADLTILMTLVADLTEQGVIPSSGLLQLDVSKASNALQSWFSRLIAAATHMEEKAKYDEEPF